MDEREQSELAVREAKEEAERNVEDLARRSEKLAEHVEETRRDWERKREDPNVPGALAPEPEEANGGAVAGDWEGEGPAANEAGQ